ncbi:MAG: F0F1 ATP synthase subunit delta [Gammaproteobacteria bacterium]
MAETTTIARPYAQAAFELARAENALPVWSEMLTFVAAVAKDPQIAALLNSPRVSRAQLADLFISVAGERLNLQGSNFIRLLAENRRLDVLTEIAALYQVMRAAAEGVLEAEMISAQPVSDAQRAQMTAALKARLQRDVNLTVSTDASLLGGAIIRAGDLVIDGSARGKLAKLAVALNR